MLNQTRFAVIQAGLVDQRATLRGRWRIILGAPGSASRTIGFENMTTFESQPRTLSLRPFRFLQDLEEQSAKREVIIVKVLPVSEKAGPSHHIYHGFISRSSGKSGSQIMLTNAHEVTSQLDVSELKRGYDPEHGNVEHLHGHYVEELVGFFRNLNDPHLPVQERLWVNLGFDCLSFLVEESSA